MGKSSKYIKKGLLISVYNNNKHQATSHGILLMMSGKIKQAMHVLEERSLISKDESNAAWNEYINGYLQHHYFKDYKHAKYHYFASMLHCDKIPEVRYNLTV